MFGGETEKKPFEEVENIVEGPGLTGEPTAIQDIVGKPKSQGAPWSRAVADAADLRRAIGNPSGPIDNVQLCEFLGIETQEFEQWSPSKRSKAAIAVTENAKKYKFFPRKKHPKGKRFELARFIGDYLLVEKDETQWLASTDLRTSRQKYQRAFAAEFLCPIEALCEYLENDYSESAVEDAADHFEVSQETFESSLANKTA